MTLIVVSYYARITFKYTSIKFAPLKHTFPYFLNMSKPKILLEDSVLKKRIQHSYQKSQKKEVIFIYNKLFSSTFSFKNYKNLNYIEYTIIYTKI